MKDEGPQRGKRAGALAAKSTLPTWAGNTGAEKIDMTNEAKAAGEVIQATAVAAALDRMRAARPLVQNITNYVSMDIAANALLALGASPAMVHAHEEVDDFGAFAGAVVINIGTLSGPWVDSMVKAASGAHERGTPWVLDPVGAGATRFRNETVVALMASQPTVIRGNASEILAVASACGISPSDARPKGVDSSDSADDALFVAKKLATESGSIVVASGAVDVVTDGTRTARVANGSPLMTQVTAIGCSLSSIVGAFLATTADCFDATVAAVAVTAIAGDMAAEQARLPGSFRVAFIDSLATIDRDAIARRLRLQTQ